MGAGASKEDLLFRAVKDGRLDGLQALRKEGANLEHRDSKGQTALMLACSRPEYFDAAHTLLQLGASRDAYARGPEGGTPIHIAARKRLTRTVELLLNYGADPLQRNDIGRSALEFAREQHNAPMVHLIESRVALFAGPMRQHKLASVFSHPLLKAALEVAVPQWVYSIVWVSVVPAARGSPVLSLAIYSSTAAGMPSSVLPLQEYAKSLSREDSTDPKCILQNVVTREKLKFGSEPPDQPLVVQRFFNACNGTPLQLVPGYAHPHASLSVPPPQPLPQQQLQQQQQPPVQQQQPVPGAPAAVPGGGVAPALAKAASAESAAATAGLSGALSEKIQSFQSADMDDDAALRLAMEESMRMASASRPGWEEPHAGAQAAPPPAADYNGWGPAPPQAPKVQQSYGGWGADVQVQQSPVSAPRQHVQAAAAPPAAAPSPASPAPRAPAPAPQAQAQHPQAAPASVATGAPPAPYPAGAAAAPTPGPAGDAAAASAPPPPAGVMYPSIDTSPVSINYSALAATPPPPAPPPEAPTLLNPAFSALRVKEEQKKAEESRGEGGQCTICWDSPAHAVCVPCGHIAGCMECLTEVKAKGWGCPICKADIQHVMKVYHV